MRELLAKLQIWYVKKCFKHGRDYEFYLDLNDVEAYAVKLLRKYPDTIVEFKNVTAGEDGALSFDFVVVANPKLHNTKSKRFQNFTSNVMRSIIFTAIDNFERNIDDHRATNPDQLDQERTIHEESDPVLEARVSERKPRKKAVRRNKKLHTEV
jgi:hypothetical protein